MKAVIQIGEFVEEIGEHIMFREPIVTLNVPYTKEELEGQERSRKEAAEQQAKINAENEAKRIEQEAQEERLRKIERALGLRKD